MSNKTKVQTRIATPAPAPSMIAATGNERDVIPGELLPEGMAVGVVPLVHALPDSELVLSIDERLLPTRLLPLVDKVTVSMDTETVEVPLGGRVTEGD